MGWNSWNCWAGAVDDAKVRAAADWMLKSGLAAHGFQYINIDDTWEGQRDANGEILTNQKFPNMQALSDYVHSKGLKLGIYSSPGPKTCAGYRGQLPARGSGRRDLREVGHRLPEVRLVLLWRHRAPATRLRSCRSSRSPTSGCAQSLDKADRDIVYSLCQYGMANVWEWGASDERARQLLAHDRRHHRQLGSLHGIYSSQNGHEKFAGPGHWNDPDMLIVGKVGLGAEPARDASACPTSSCSTSPCGACSPRRCSSAAICRR